MNLRRDGSAHQRQQINLRIAREDQARVEETVDPRRFVSIAAVQRKSAFTQARHRAHDTVRFEDTGLAVGAERSRHGAERMRLQKGAALMKLGGEANLTRRRIRRACSLSL